MSRIYGSARTRLIEFIESKDGEPVTMDELREALPDISTSVFTSQLANMVNAGDVDRKYRGVYVAKTGVSAANS